MKNYSLTYLDASLYYYLFIDGFRANKNTRKIRYAHSPFRFLALHITQRKIKAHTCSYVTSAFLYYQITPFGCYSKKKINEKSAPAKTQLIEKSQINIQQAKIRWKKITLP